MDQRIETLFSEKELLEITKALISIPSHTAYINREKEIADYIFDIFQKENIECIKQIADGDRYNIIATIRGDGSGSSLMLNGHMDTVPVDEMDAPFDPQVKGGFMYGRGTSDMKSGLAAMIYAMLLVKRSGICLKGDLVFAGVIDEEAAKSTGSRVVADKGPKTDYAIVGEPTGLFPVIAHKGIDYFQINLSGVSAHSSLPKNGANAIYAAADFISLVRCELAELYETLVHPLVGAPSMNVGLVTGAAKINSGFLKGTSETFAGVVPDAATVYVDVRWTPYQSVEEILGQLNDIARRTEEKNPRVTAEVTYIPLPRPAMEIQADALLTRSLLKNTEELSPHTARATGVSYFADSGILYGVGNIQSVVFGPGDISVAHSPEEKVEVEQIYKAAKIYVGTALDVCSKGMI